MEGVWAVVGAIGAAWAAWVTGVLWAQAAGDGGTPTTIIGAFIFAFIAMIGLFGWLIRHIFGTTMPALTKSFDDGMQAAKKSHEEAIGRLTSSHEGVVNKITTSHDTNMGKVVAVAAEEQTKLRDLFDRRQEALVLSCREEAARERDASEKRFQAAREQMDRHHQEEMTHLREQLQAQLQQGRNVLELQQMLRHLLASFQHRTRAADVVVGADDAIWTKSLDGVITSWNRSAEHILGWRAAEIVGQSVYKIVPPDRHEEERAMMDRLRKGERVEPLRTERLHSAGHLVRLHVAISPVMDATGKVHGLSSIAREL